MFPIWDVPSFVLWFSDFRPLLLGAGTYLLWFLTAASVVVQLAVLGFGIFTINETIQKSE